MQHRSFNIHERFIKHIWSKQYLKSDLKTLDGQPLKVIDIGRQNSDSGPDFHDAKIKVNGITYSGDVEIHRTVFDWIQHQHQEDTRYNKVILHVVLEAASDTPPTLVHSGRQIPVLVLGTFLSESIHKIWQRTILDERAEKSKTIQCFRKNESVSALMLDQWLSKLAVERLELKLRRFEERLKQLAYEKRMTVQENKYHYGEPRLEGNYDEIPPPMHELTQRDFSCREIWEQTLYEGVMEGLGYSKNREPFLKLAQNLTLKKIGAFISQNTTLKIDSLLFGTAGLIPRITSLKEKESREYVRRLSHEWKIIKSSILVERLHNADWQFFPTRPSNFPTLRIAAACKLIDNFLIKDSFRCIIQIMKSDISAEQKEHKLVNLFSIEIIDFWRSHYNFDYAASKKVTALGNTRIYQIIINAVLPLVLSYARIFKDKIVRDGALEVYKSIIAFEDNSITRLMEKQLLRGKLFLKSVSHQQALIQLYKYYCMEERCLDCEIGKTL